MTKSVSPFLSTATIIVCFGALIGAAIAGFSALVVLLGLALAAALVTKVWSRLCLKGVTCERRLSEKRVFPGDEVLLTLRVVNRKVLPLPWIEIQDEVPASLVARANGAGREPSRRNSRTARPCDSVSIDSPALVLGRHLHSTAGLLGPGLLSLGPPLGGVRGHLRTPSPQPGATRYRSPHRVPAHVHAPGARHPLALPLG